MLVCTNVLDWHLLTPCHCTCQGGTTTDDVTKPGRTYTYIFWFYSKLFSFSRSQETKFNFRLWRGLTETSCVDVQGHNWFKSTVIEKISDDYDFPGFLSSIPVKRILHKPQIVRGLGSNLHTDVNANQSRAGGSLLNKVQRSRHKNLYDINHQIRVRLCLVLEVWGINDCSRGNYNL